MGLPDALLPYYMFAAPSPHPRRAGANRCAVWLAAHTAVGVLSDDRSRDPSPLLRSYAEAYACYRRLRE